MGIEAALELPWWWVLIYSLLKRFDNIREYGSMAQDGKAPSKEIWLDDDELEAWRKNQDELRKRPEN